MYINICCEYLHPWFDWFIYKGKYFGQKRPPPPQGEGNKFNSRKNREEIQFQRKSKKLTMFMSFMDIFPVFDEFLGISSLFFLLFVTLNVFHTIS